MPVAHFIDTMPAGRELDALVAEKVIGGKTSLREMGIDLDTVGWGWSPSTDIAAAWKIIEKMAIFDFDCEISLCAALPEDDSEKYYCHFQYGDDNAPWKPEFKLIQQWAPTAPLAICRAAVKAMTS